MNERGLLTAQELAAELTVSVETVWRYTREKRIPFVQLGSRRYRYDPSAVVAVLTRGDDTPLRETSSKDRGGGLTYEDYAKMPEEPQYKMEILDGCLVKEPSPVVHHQRVSRRLQRALEDYFASRDPRGEVFGAPLDISLSEHNVVQPDLFYVPGENSKIIEEKRVKGAPALVLEILSPHSRRRDRIQKMGVYARTDVQHYWIVDPDEDTLEAFALADGHYYIAATGVDEQTFEHPDFPGLSIPLGPIWSRPPRPGTTAPEQDTEPQTLPCKY